MDSRFLFRGKRVDNGEWVYGDLIDGFLIRQHTPKSYFSHTKLGMLSCDDTYRVDPTTIGQCTGLSAENSYRGDRANDLLAFDGDIVDCIAGRMYIEWDKAKACFVASRDGDPGNRSPMRVVKAGKIVETVHDY